MTDHSTTLAQLRERVATFNRERDWGRYHSSRNVAMALSVEASELLELFLWSADAGPQPPVGSRDAQVAQEMADVLICLLTLAEVRGVDLSGAVLAKLDHNALKYPVEKAKGRLERSDEL